MFLFGQHGALDSRLVCVLQGWACLQGLAPCGLCPSGLNSKLFLKSSSASPPLVQGWPRPARWASPCTFPPGGCFSHQLVAPSLRGWLMRDCCGPSSLGRGFALSKISPLSVKWTRPPSQAVGGGAARGWEFGISQDALIKLVEGFWGPDWAVFHFPKTHWSGIVYIMCATGVLLLGKYLGVSFSRKHKEEEETGDFKKESRTAFCKSWIHFSHPSTECEQTHIPCFSNGGVLIYKAIMQSSSQSFEITFLFPSWRWHGVVMRLKALWHFPLLSAHG